MMKRTSPRVLHRGVSLESPARRTPGGKHSNNVSARNSPHDTPHRTHRSIASTTLGSPTRRSAATSHDYDTLSCSDTSSTESSASRRVRSQPFQLTCPNTQALCLSALLHEQTAALQFLMEMPVTQGKNQGLVRNIQLSHDVSRELRTFMSRREREDQKLDRENVVRNSRVVRAYQEEQLAKLRRLRAIVTNSSRNATGQMDTEFWAQLHKHGETVRDQLVRATHELSFEGRVTGLLERLQKERACVSAASKVAQDNQRLRESIRTARDALKKDRAAWTEELQRVNADLKQLQNAVAKQRKDNTREQLVRRNEFEASRQTKIRVFSVQLQELTEKVARLQESRQSEDKAAVLTDGYLTRKLHARAQRLRECMHRYEVDVAALLRKLEAVYMRQQGVKKELTDRSAHLQHLLYLKEAQMDKVVRTRAQSNRLKNAVSVVHTFLKNWVRKWKERKRREREAAAVQRRQAALEARRMHKKSILVAKFNRMMGKDLSMRRS